MKINYKLWLTLFICIMFGIVIIKVMNTSPDMKLAPDYKNYDQDQRQVLIEKKQTFFDDFFTKYVC